jgi:PhnB protein
MENVHVPEGYTPLIPYLILRQAVGFMDFAKAVLAANEKMAYKNEDGSLMHGELVLPGGGMLMVGEASEEWPQNTAGIFLYVQDVDVTYAAALAHGATSLMAVEDKDYGRTCGFKDPYGNTWWPVSQLKS